MFKLILTICLVCSVYGDSASVESEQADVVGSASASASAIESAEVKSLQSSRACPKQKKPKCGGSTKIKLEIEIPAGSCGGGFGPPTGPEGPSTGPEGPDGPGSSSQEGPGSSSQEGSGSTEETTKKPEDLCLGSENSLKISKNLLKLLVNNSDKTFEILTNLRIIDFMYANIGYNDFSANIKNNDYSYTGYEKLKSLVKKYRVCKKVCKVYSQLRQALLQNAAYASIVQDSGTVTVNGDFTIVSQIRQKIEELINGGTPVTNVNFVADTFIADDNLMSSVWGGVIVNVKATNFIIPRDLLWDASAKTGLYLFFKFL